MDKYKKALEHFTQEMIEEIEDNWDLLTEKGCGAERNMPDAATYLGHSIKGMSQEEIDEEVSEIQLAYYSYEECTFDELVDKYNQIYE